MPSFTTFIRSVSSTMSPHPMVMEVSQKAS